MSFTISQLTPKGATLGLSDILEIETPVGGGLYETKRVTGQEIKNLVSATGIHALVAPFPGKSYMPMITFGTLAAFATTANLIRLYPFIPARNITISSLSLNVTVSGAAVNTRFLVYDDLNGTPNNKLIESTNLDCSSTGVKTFSTTYTFVAGQTYWVGNHNSGVFTLQHINTANLLLIHNTTVGNIFTGVTYSYTFGSAPASLNGIAATYSNGAFPAIMINI